MKRLVIVFLLSAIAAHAQSIFIVRHAERASSERDTALSDAGFKRAECLARTLRDAQIKSGFVTEFKRTQQTAEPELKQAGVTATVVPAADVAQTAALAKKAAVAGNVLVVGHSNTVPQIVQSLTGDAKPGQAPAPNMSDSEYDRLTIVQFFGEANPQVTTLHYCISGPVSSK
ncbi:MAG: histidine phosphatase family protein [Acidobacteriaceae bacterium]|jgi:phosphohistidine phosphatase SixA|nr:histidine phosphatase family protein [Acidobacteriaceae bacterium]